MGKFITELFAKQITNKIEALNFQSSYIPEGFKQTWFENVSTTGDYKIEDCILDVDGYWRSKEMDSGNGRGENTQYHKFLWRLEPTYCVHGRPFYSQEQIAEFYKKSEAKKSVLKLTKSEVCLEWDGFDSPTETNWGLRMRQPFVTIYENEVLIFKGEISIYKRGWKKELTDFVMEYYKWVKKS